MIKNFEIAQALLDQKGEITGQTYGNSMWPLFRSQKDKAVIIPVPKNIKVGDVLLYKNASGDVNLHRVIKIAENSPVLRGDNLYYKETSIPKNYIIGLLKGFYRNDKYYDCQSHFGYKLYVKYILISYPLRRLAKKIHSLFYRIKRTA